MDKNIFEIVEDVLKTREKYVSEDNKLLKAIVYSDVMTMNNELLTLLLSNEQIKERFFENVNGTLVLTSRSLLGLLSLKNSCQTHIRDIQIKLA